MEAALPISSNRSTNFRLPALQNPSLTISFPSTLRLPTTRSTKCPTQTLLSCQPRPQTTDSFHGLCYVVGDNIDTDQMIQAEFCTLVSTIPEEYNKLGSHALQGLPADTYPTRFVDEGRSESKYSIIVGGRNFGCGSSREHAPMALGAAGTTAVVAESFARIFFRNSVSTGEVYPLEAELRICDECSTGDEVTVELEGCRLVNHTTGKEYRLKPIGDAGPVIEAGGIFAYARKSGMIPSLAD